MAHWKQPSFATSKVAMVAKLRDVLLTMRTDGSFWERSLQLFGAMVLNPILMMKNVFSSPKLAMESCTAMSRESLSSMDTQQRRVSSSSPARASALTTSTDVPLRTSLSRHSQSQSPLTDKLMRSQIRTESQRWELRSAPTFLMHSLFFMMIRISYLMVQQAKQLDRKSVV